MTATKSLPVRPSLESLRKQAKTLARDVAGGDADAIARARAQLPHVNPPLTRRNAQLVIAREYGFPGWQDLNAEVQKRLGNSLEWAASRAQRLIHDDEVDRLRELIAEYPALLSWRGEDWDSSGGLVGVATGAYGDCFEPGREQSFTRAACAQLLIDAGAVVLPVVCDGLVQSRARGLLNMFQRKGLLPRTLKFVTALGDIDGVRGAADEQATNLAAINEAFMCACRFDHEAIALLLLERSIALDAELGARIDGGPGRLAFVRFFIDAGTLDEAATFGSGPWNAFVMGQISRAAREGDVTTFVGGLQREPWLLGDDFVGFQVRMISTATLNDRGSIIAALLDLRPALLQQQPPPPSQAIEFAFTYGHMQLLPLLTRVWPVPDDLPHAAGSGDLPRVQRWFDERGQPALGQIANHAPATSVHPREPEWGKVGVQEVLDSALAYAVINRRFDVADFMLAHGANINTNWNSHEPASILHHLVFLPDSREPMQYLIDRGIDLTMKDYRWNSTAEGWARYGKNDTALADWLEDAARQREERV